MNATSIGLPALGRNEAARLVRWWLGELRELLPERMRRQSLSGNALILLAGPNGYDVVARRNTRIVEMGRLELPQPIAGRRRGPAPVSFEPRARNSVLLRKLRRMRLPIVLRLPAEAGLVCSDQLPPSAEGDLASIMHHKIDLLTPWTTDQVYHDQTIRARNPGGLLDISLVAVPRLAVDAAISRLSSLGLEPNSVDIVAASPSAAPQIDLLKRDMAGGRTRLWQTLLWVLGAVALVGASLAGKYMLDRAAEIDQRRALVARMEQAVGDLAELRSTTDTLRSEANFVAAHRKATVSPLFVLESLSRLLPDTVWLGELQITGDKLVITGFARDASTVISLLEKSRDFAGTEFNAPSNTVSVQLADGSQTDLDRFSLSTNVAPVRTLEP